MNEEMNKTIEEIDNVEVITEVGENLSDPGTGILAKIAIGTLIVGAGVGAFLYTQRDKIKARRIEKLRREGYIIQEPGQTEDVTEDFEGEIVED